MHWLDSSILAVLAAAAVLGAYSGLLMQVFRLVGFGVALYAATLYYGGATEWLKDNLMRGADARTCSLVAFGMLFLGIYLAIFLITLLLERGMRATQLQFVNRCLGATLAVFKVGVLIGTICYSIQQLPYQPATQMLEESAMAPLLVKGVEHALLAVPAEYKTEWTNAWNQVREALPSKLDKLKSERRDETPGNKS
jgi:membrane protein required for colicin V production